MLESAAVCPGCRHHLRFSGSGQARAADESYCALSVDGTIAHKASASPASIASCWMSADERGEQLVRQVVGVGVLQPGELRRVNLSVEMMPVRSAAAAKAAAKAPSAAAPAPLAAKAASTVPAGAASAPAIPAPQPARPGQAAGGGAETAKDPAPPLLNPPQPGAKPPSTGPLMPGRSTQRMRIFPKR